MLRATGREGRAERLETLKRQQSESRLDWSRLVTDLQMAYEKGAIITPDQPLPPEPSRLRDGRVGEPGYPT